MSVESNDLLASRLEDPSLIVAGVLRMSTIDYPDKLASVVYFQGCSMKCPYCHNAKLADGGLVGVHLLDALRTVQRPGINGIVLTGGEPMLCDRLADVVAFIHYRGKSVKLDTNGVTGRIDGLAATVMPGDGQHTYYRPFPDYVALDIKFPKADYPKHMRESYLEHELQEMPVALRDLGDVEARKVAVDVAMDTLAHNILYVQRNKGEYRTTVHRKLLPPEKLQELDRDFLQFHWEEGTRKPWYLQQFRKCECWDKELNDSDTYSDEELADLAIENHAYVRGVRDDLVEKVRREVDNQAKLKRQGWCEKQKGDIAT